MATREEAFRAGYENPLIGAIEPLQRLYGTVRAMGEELGGADMGTPAGARFSASQKQSKAEAKRLKALREQFPEEFGRGQMQAQDVADPYMLGLGTMPMGMRPGVTQGPRALPGAGGRPMVGGPGMMEGELMPAPAGYLGYAPPMVQPRGLPPMAPAAPYYRNVPSEMGTSMRPMNAFQQNQVGMATGRFGPSGYAPEMAVTDFETYGPMGARPTPGPYAPSGFDRNMLEAFRAGRANYRRNVRPEPMGGGFTLEELGQAVSPYRENGLVYEPVGAVPQGRANLPAFASGRGMRPTMMEGEFREIPGIGYAPQGYGGGMDFDVTRAGMAMPPSGLPFDPRVAAAAGGAGFLGGAFGGGQRASTALSGAAPGGPTPLAGQQTLPPITRFGAAPQQQQTTSAKQMPAQRKAAGKGKAAGRKMQGPEMPAEQPFDPNLNYYVTQALDALLGQNEAERGMQYQQNLARQGYYY